MKMGILGCGKMAGAMLERWLQTGQVDAANVRAVTRSRASAARVHQHYGVAAGTDTGQLLDWADVILLGIKPQQVAAVAPTWRAHVRPDQVWLSVLAGTTSARLRALLGGGAPVVRLMPNTPVRLGLGATAVVWPPDFPADQRAALTTLLADLGDVVPLQEDRIDAFTAIAGSGPAYVFLFVESLTAAAVRLGFGLEEARTMALGVVRGATQLAAEDGRDPAILRAEVTSPGGMTQAALAVYEEMGWTAVTATATQAAVDRAAELAAS